MNIIKNITICLNCGCRQDIVDYQMGLLKPLHQHYKVYWNNRIDRHPATYRSFSKLVNHSIETSPTETVVFINDRCHPRPEEVVKMVSLLENGFAAVYLYNAGFFGFTKELIRKIGWWDERHLNGDVSDQELCIRLKEADLAFYESQESVYDQSWRSPLQNNEEYPNKIMHWVLKWDFREDAVVRKMEEENYDYKLESIDYPLNIKWMPWSESILGIKYPYGVAPSLRVLNKKVVYEKSNT
jgi:hypothetical protein